MTDHRAVNLRDHEVRALLEQGNVLVVRAMKPQPIPPVAKYERGGDLWIAKGATADVERQFCTTWPLPIMCPFGAPVQALYGREAWRPHNDPSLYTCIQYRADMACVKPTEWDHNAGYWCESAAGEENADTSWRSPAIMPRWAVRPEFARLVLRRVEVKKMLETGISGIELSRYKELGGISGNPWVWLAEIAVAAESEGE